MISKTTRLDSPISMAPVSLPPESLHPLLLGVYLNDPNVLNHPEISLVKDSWGVTPLHYAVEQWEKALKHPAVATVKDAQGCTPLHYAAPYWVSALNHPQVAEVRDNYGNTPLHVAAGYWEAALYHPLAGIVKNNLGETPVREAVTRNLRQALEHPSALIMQDDGDYLIHTLSRMMNSKVVDRPEFTTLRNLWGQTPKQVWGVLIETNDPDPSDDGIYQEEEENHDNQI